jgi:hypothetical protein
MTDTTSAVGIFCGAERCGTCALFDMMCAQLILRRKASDVGWEESVSGVSDQHTRGTIDETWPWPGGGSDQVLRGRHLLINLPMKISRKRVFVCVPFSLGKDNLKKCYIVHQYSIYYTTAVLYWCT